MIPSVIGKIVWRGKQVMDKVEARVQENLDKAAILLQTEIVKSFGSPPSMPEGQLTPYGVRKLASRVRKQAIRSEKRRWRRYKKEQKAELRQMKVQERRRKAMKREAMALARAGKHEWGD